MVALLYAGWVAAGMALGSLCFLFGHRAGVRRERERNGRRAAAMMMVRAAILTAAQR